MPFMVIYRSAEGKPAYHQAEALDDAVRFVEHVRNNEKVGDARIFSMQEVPIEFRTYYRVEVAGGEAPAPAPVPESVTVSAAPPVAPRASLAEAVPGDATKTEATIITPANGSGRFGLFGKG